MAGADKLFAVKNNFYLGAHQAAINSSDIKGLSDLQAVERDFFVYRSYIALGSYELVIEEIKGGSVALDAVKLLARYLSGDKENAKSVLKEWLADPAIATNTDVLLIAGTVFAQEHDYNEALKCTHAGETLELCALNIHMYIKMNRPDLAEKQLKAMQKMDEDHTLTQLANAWVDLALGGPKIVEASYIFQELSEKYAWTVPLMNGRAICYMGTGSFEDAESMLLEALSKDAKDGDTLANLVVCNLHLGKPVARYMTQLKTQKPEHPLVQRQSDAESNFLQAAQAVSAA